MDSPGAIPSFYKNRSVFITGATGFLGKATIEKLLRKCPEVQTVYVLIRPKTCSDVRNRLAELLESSFFDILKQHDPQVLKKIVPINGDISLPYLGISETDQQELIEKVSIVIHSAATIKFDEKLKLAVNLNVQGTKRIVELCKQLRNLKALVHVSTAYANCEREEIGEVVYPPPVDPHDLIKLLEGKEDSLITSITSQLIGSKPNTYTFTKALAEHILGEEAQNLPIYIVRPSIVTGAWKEPVPGWVDNVNGATGIMIAIGKGILRTLVVDRKKLGDLIPLDITVNLILASAWQISKQKPNGIKVYNCCSGTENPLTWGQFHKYIFNNWENNPLSDVLWYPATTFRTNKMWHKINDFCFQFIPAYLLDTVAKVTGRKAVMRKIYAKVIRAFQPLEYFATNQWQFKTDNVVALHDMLSVEDKRAFCLDVKEINWPAYMETYCLGIRKYTLKDNDSTLMAARKHVRKLFWLHNFTKSLFLMIICAALMFAYKCTWKSGH